MNKKGFTLVEVIVVISLLGLVVIITSTSILSGSTRAKEKMLETKIKNIEKAAILYGQDNRNKINVIGNDSDLHPLCFKEGSATPIPNCYYFSNNGTNSSVITVGFLADNPDGDDTTDDAYLEYDKDSDIVNPVDESKVMNSCEIQIYQKYGKIYADFIEEKDGNNVYNKNCWK